MSCTPAFSMPLTQPLNIVTWNVNSLRVRQEQVVHMLKEQAIDIALLQETKVQNEAFPKEPFEDLGYNVICHGQKTYNGVAVLSKYPIHDAQTTLPFPTPNNTKDFAKESGAAQSQDARHVSESDPSKALHSLVSGTGTLPFPMPGEEKQPSLQKTIPAEEAEARYLQVETAGIVLASIYVPNGQVPGHEKFFWKKRFYQALSVQLQNLLQHETPLVWGGDYNVAPSDADVWDAKIWKDRILCTPEERLWFRTLMAQGLYDPLDTWPDASEKNDFTWWDYKTKGFQKERGLRIDHMLLSPWAADWLQEAKVLADFRGLERPSDHAPVFIRLDPADKPKKIA